MATKAAAKIEDTATPTDADALAVIIAEEGWTAQKGTAYVSVWEAPTQDYTVPAVVVADEEEGASA
jgi:hypothetical protein